MDLYGVIAGTFVIFFFILYIVLILIGFANYILMALGLSKVAKTTNMSKPWLAWIPFANYWLTGAVADKIELENGRKKNYAKICLWVYIGAILLLIPGAFLSSLGSVLVEYEPEIAAIFSLTSIPFSLLSSILSIVTSVFFYIAVFKIFKQFVPQKATLYLVLSIIVPLAFGICLMKLPKNTEPDLPIV